MTCFVGQQHNRPEGAEKRSDTGTFCAVMIEYDAIKTVRRFRHVPDIGAGGHRVSLCFQSEPQRLAKVGIGGDNKEVAHGRVQIPESVEEFEANLMLKRC